MYSKKGSHVFFKYNLKNLGLNLYY